MDWGRVVPVFHVVVWFQVVLAHVEPPTEVTLHCHNLHNVLKWSYTQFSPELRFKIDIASTLGLSSLPDEIWVEPPVQEADVSFLSDPNNEYYLQVIAVMGDNNSDPAPPDGITFSYFKDSPVNQKCSVDLPLVNVTAQRDASVLFHFTHPWLLYYKKLTGNSNGKHRKRTSHDEEPQIEEPLPEFNYIVTMDQNHHDFICEERVCEEMLPVDATQQNHCLTIVGDLQKIRVKGTQSYCAAPFQGIPESNNIIYIVISLLSVGVAVVFVALMVYRRTTRPSSLLPSSILVNQKSHQTFSAEPDEIHVPEVDPTTPTPLLSGQTIEDEFISTVTPHTDTFHLPIKGIIEDEGVCVMEAELNNEEPGYMGGMDLDEDETENSNEVSSGYERRNVLANLGPDDRTEGYRG